MLRYALRLTHGHREDAEDLVHAAWLRMAEAYGDQVRHPRTLMYRIMVNLRKNEISRLIRERRYRRLEIAGEVEMPCLDAERALQALEALPSPFGDTCRRYFREGHGQKEIARADGLPVGTVKTRIYRATRAI